MAGTADDQNLTFTHNPAGQISTRINSNPAYNWDGVGIASEDYSVNGLNQAVQASFGIIAYDARGNMTSAGNRNYGYNIYNQLTSVNDSTNSASMSYDAYGRLSQSNGNLDNTKFSYSGNQMIAEFNGSGTMAARYVYGPGSDNVLMQYNGSGTSNREWLIADVRGSIVAITDNTGTVTNINKYNEYGVPSVNNVGRFQYTGQMWLKEAEVYHYKARAYDPYIGRFLQTDPIGYGDGMNMYAYVGGDPVNLRDPSGLHDEIVVWGQRPGCPSGSICDPNAIRDILTNVIENIFQDVLDAFTDWLSDPSHFYVTENIVCADASNLTQEDIANAMSRHTVPSIFNGPVKNNSTNLATDPRNGFPGGFVRTNVSSDGLTGTNVTTRIHFLYNGDVTRTAFIRSGALVIRTVGTGTNRSGVLARLNDWQGPQIMNAEDAQMATALAATNPECAG